MEESESITIKPKRQARTPLQQVLSYAWSWNVVLFLVGIIGLPAYGVLVAMNEFEVANWIFIGSTLLMLTKLVTWAAPKRPAATRNLLIVGSVVICGLALVIQNSWLRQQEKKTLQLMAAKAPSPPVPAAASPAIMFSYDSLKLLPISIGPHSTTLICQLHQNITDGFFSESNSGDKPYEWPPYKRLKSEQTDEFIAEYTLTNYGDKPVINAALAFNVQFLAAAKHNSTKRSRSSDGLYHTEIPGPPRGGSSTLEHISGEILSSHKHTLVIPAIEPKLPFRFYIVNQTKNFAKVFLPAKAKLRVAGESEDRQIELNRKEVNIVDKAPYFILPPSGILWMGLPDSPIPSRDVPKTGV